MADIMRKEGEVNLTLLGYTEGKRHGWKKTSLREWITKQRQRLEG